MKGENTESVIGFIGGHLFWLFITHIWYRNALFRCLLGMSFRHSIQIYLGLIILSTAVTMIINIRNNRNMLTVAVGIALPLGVYTALAYWTYYKGIISVLVITGAVVSAVYGVLLFSRSVKNRAMLRQIIGGRVFRYVHGTRIIGAVCLAIFTVPMLVKALIGLPLFRPQVEAQAARRESQYTIAANIDTVCMLQEDIWSGLSIEEKLNVLQIIANIEANYLGIATELRVTADDLDESIWGQYRDTEHRISINIDHLKYDTAENVLRTLCHEAYHGYEWRLAELYGDLDEEDKKLLLFLDAAAYQKEFADYESEEGYYSQTVEVDARAYADVAVEDYYERIEAHLENGAG